MIVNVAELQRRVDSHRSDIERLTRELNDLLSLQVDTLPFLEFPRELRDEVYQYLLAPSGEAFPSIEREDDDRVLNHNDKEQPQYALLAVNHQMRVEAAEILLKKNNFVINRSQKGYELLLGRRVEGMQAYDPSLGQCFALPPQWHLSRLARGHLTSVSLALDMRAITPLALADRLAVAGSNRKGLTWRTELHDPRVIAAHGLERVFQRNGEDALRCLVECCPSLRSLQLDVTNCYCAMGCCRAVGMLAANLKELQFGEKMTHLEVLGTLTAKERELIVSALSKPSRLVEVRENMIVSFKKFESADYDHAQVMLWNEFDDRTTRAYRHVKLDEELENEEINLCNARVHTCCTEGEARHELRVKNDPRIWYLKTGWSNDDLL